LSLRRTVFLDLDLKLYRDLETGLGSLKVIGTDTNQSAIYDFLLTLSLSRTVSEMNSSIV